MQANAQITAAFGEQASKAVGDYAAKQMEQASALLAKASNTEDPAEKAALLAQADKLENDWGRDGSLRILAHTTVGALTGGVGGAAGAAAGTITSAQVGKALEGNSELPQGLKDTLVSAAAVAAGAAVGNGSGGAAGYNEVVNNYLTLQQILEMNEALKTCGDRVGGASCEPVWEKYKQLEMAQQDQLEAECGANPSTCAQKYAFLNEERDAALKALEDTGRLIRWNELGASQVVAILGLKQSAAWQQVGTTGIVSGAADQFGLSQDLAELLLLGASSIGPGSPRSGGKGKADNSDKPAAGQALNERAHLPIPEKTPVTTPDGKNLTVSSNPKHSGAGRNPIAGVEPRNSLELFEKSVVVRGDKARYSIDKDGHVHRFSPDDKTGSFHWSGSTGDTRNPLDLRPTTRRDLGLRPDGNFNPRPPR